MDYHKYNTMNKSLMLQTATEHKAFYSHVLCYTTVKAIEVHLYTAIGTFSKLPLKSADGELLDAIQGKAFYEDQKGPSHGGGFPWDRLQKTQGKIRSLEATHQDSGGSGRLGTISKRMCIFFPGNGSIAFIKFTKVSVNLKKVKNTPPKEAALVSKLLCQGCGEKRTLLHAGGNVRYSRFGKQSGGSLKKLKIELPCDPAAD